MSASAQQLDLPVTHSRVGVIPHLTPHIALTTEPGLDQLTDTIGECTEQREIKLVIDMSAQLHLNSAALETLLDQQDHLMRLGGWLKLGGINELEPRDFQGDRSRRSLPHSRNSLDQETTINTETIVLITPHILADDEQDAMSIDQREKVEAFERDASKEAAALDDRIDRSSERSQGVAPDGEL